MSGRTRREFLMTTIAGGVIAPTLLRARTPPVADPQAARVRIGLIGAGGQGMSDTRTSLRVPCI